MNTDRSRIISRDEEKNTSTKPVANEATVDSKTKVDTAHQMSTMSHRSTLKDDVPFVDLHDDTDNDSIDAAYTQPYRLNGVEEHILLDEIVLYFPEREVAFSLNSSAKAIWELCDGKHTVNEISQELSSLFSCSREELLSDVKATVIQLHKHVLLELRNISRTKST